jgi:hypothetical protein
VAEAAPIIMPDPRLLDRAFQVIMRGFVERGYAPHYAEVAAGLGLGVEEGRRTVHDVIGAFFPGWLHPGTDYIASFPPFNSLPTQYRVAVDGRSRWFAQCGFEALAVTWLFPGRGVRVEAPCLDCGEPMVLEMRDGRFQEVSPAGIVGHMNHPWVAAKDRLPFL